jgi:hypothetical protein
LEFDIGDSIGGIERIPEVFPLLSCLNKFSLKAPGFGCLDVGHWKRSVPNRVFEVF